MAVAVRVVLFAALLGLYWSSSRVEGVTFSLRGVNISNTSDECVLITDINPNGDNNKDALICRSELPVSYTRSRRGDWYLHPTQMSTDVADRIKNPTDSAPDRGWLRNRVNDSEGHRVLRLKRVSDTAEEGVFTCNIIDDLNNPRYLGIYYPISLSVSIGVVSGREGTFRVTCTATGGTVSTSSLTGSGLGDRGLQLQAEGGIGRTGQNTYNVTSGILSEQCNGDTYTCTAMNNVSSPENRTVLAVAGDPTLTSLNQISSTAVRVMWSPPSGGATVTGYVVHYRTNSSVGTNTSCSSTKSSPFTSTNITGLTSGATYTISVEATSQHLSGESENMTIELITTTETTNNTSETTTTDTSSGENILTTNSSETTGTDTSSGENIPPITPMIDETTNINSSETTVMVTDIFSSETTLSITPMISETTTNINASETTVTITPTISETATSINASETTVTITHTISETATSINGSESTVTVTPMISETATSINASETTVTITPTISETATSINGSETTVTITPTISETATSINGSETAVTITPTISDTAVTITPTISETATSINASETTVTITPTISETATSINGSETAVTITPTISETATSINGSETAVTITPTISETATSINGSESTVTITPMISETATSINGSESTVTITPMISETATSINGSATASAITPTISETATSINGSESTVTITPTISETATSINASETTVTITPTISETATSINGSEATVTITPTISETATSINGSEATVTITPTISVTATSINSGEATVTITPTISDTAVTITPTISETATSINGSETTITITPTVSKTGVASISNSKTTTTISLSNGPITPITDGDSSDVIIVVGVVTVLCITAIIIVLILLVIWYKRRNNSRITLATKMSDVFNLTTMVTKIEHFRAGVGDSAKSTEEDSDDDYIEDISTFLPGSNAIAVDQFQDYLQNKSMLKRQYRNLQLLPQYSYDDATIAYNTYRNRFRNILPYDNSRVHLKDIAGEAGSDYINASFITGYGDKPRAYIASQGPLKETTDDFWRMVWEYKVQAIVMLTRCVEIGKEKCAWYWPNKLNDRYSGDKFTVTLTSTTPHVEYRMRCFEVQSLQEPRDNSLTVTHFHYTAWPDHGVPDNAMSVISFIHRVHKLFPATLDQPLLVHCSAGVGRTGTFITLDMMMQQIEAEATLSIYHCVRNLRTQRMHMVQTLAQYEFIHHALSELVVCGETEVTAFSLKIFTERLNDRMEDSELTVSQTHFQTLEHLSEKHKSIITAAKSLDNISKNRYCNKLPCEMYQVKLSYNHQPGSDYINASFINGYKQKDAYIATQGPLQNTVEDFWRMMWEYQCGCIVMLCQQEEDGQESSYCYWPEEVGEMMVCGMLRVRLRQVNTDGDIVERKMEVTTVEETAHQSETTKILIVTMIQLISWPKQGLPHPSSITSVIGHLTVAQMRSSSKQTVVMCSDGVTRTGTFICIHSQLERLKTEGVVDVFQAIKSARTQRPGLIPDVAHYVFCYEVLAHFVRKMEAYANFKTVV